MIRYDSFIQEVLPSDVHVAQFIHFYTFDNLGNLYLYFPN